MNSGSLQEQQRQPSRRDRLQPLMGKFEPADSRTTLPGISIHLVLGGWTLGICTSNEAPCDAAAGHTLQVTVCVVVAWLFVYSFV